jgi:hypothetical protein
MDRGILGESHGAIQAHDAQCGGAYGACTLRHQCERFLRIPSGTWRPRFDPTVLGEDCEHFVPIDADD